VGVELLSRLHYRAGVPKSEGWLRVRFDGKALVLKGNNKFDEIVTEVGGRRQRAGFAVGCLLGHLRGLARGPVLLGTWADAVWAIRFYEKHGFREVGPEQKERLLRRYWKIPDQQVDASVVLVDGG
jgi:GNAT superfamily N-acetyltransferase